MENKVLFVITMNVSSKFDCGSIVNQEGEQNTLSNLDKVFFLILKYYSQILKTLLCGVQDLNSQIKKHVLYNLYRLLL